MTGSDWDVMWDELREAYEYLGEKLFKERPAEEIERALRGFQEAWKDVGAVYDEHVL